MIRSKEAYFHDSYFKQILYDDENKILYVTCQDYHYKKLKMLTFYNVVYFEIQNGYYWAKGGDESIIDWDLIDDNSGLERLKKLNEENHSTNLDLEKKYVESYFVSSLGNKIIIICEEINYEERDMPIN